MEQVFDRVYSLTIGRNNPLSERMIPQLLVGAEPGVPQLLAANTYTDVNAKPSGAITITELKIEADIDNTKEGDSNKQGTTIRVYNLNKSNQSFISAGDVVLLRAGYKNIHGNKPPLIFSGQVLSVCSKKDGNDTITEMVCTPVALARRNIRFSKTPVRGETNIDIINFFSDFAAANGFPKGFVFVPDEVVYPSGLPLWGSFFPVMEEYCARFNLACYVTLGRLYIEPKEVTAHALARVIVNEVNVKGTIRPENDASEKPSDPAGNPPGLSLTLFLDADITPAKTLQITYGEYKGEYNIVSVKHKLDSEGGPWDTEVSCKRRSDG